MFYDLAIFDSINKILPSRYKLLIKKNLLQQY